MVYIDNIIENTVMRVLYYVTFQGALKWGYIRQVVA
jgi:hypothetical protein